jgi:proline dehydrogenase
MGWFNSLVVATVPLIPPPLVRIFASRYIAGDKLEDAVKVVKTLNERGIMATIDVLGESVTEKEQARQAVEDYKLVLSAIAENELDANISLKPTQFGLKIDYDFCLANIEELVVEAEKYGIFVRIDMEDWTCTDDTFKMTLELMKKHKEIGTVIQAKLHRTINDVEKTLAGNKVNLRLCKGGTYHEPRTMAWAGKEIVRQDFIACLDMLFSAGCYVGIATHDERLVFEGMRLARKHKLNREQYEFQMLLGVDRELRDIIVAEGHRLRIYVPFGKKWYAYSIRRLRENPDMASYIIKNIFKRYEI